MGVGNCLSVLHGLEFSNQTRSAGGGRHGLTLSVRPQNILPVAEWCWTDSRELVRSC